jgi:CRISPR system Cascade subunit CasD
MQHEYLLFRLSGPLSAWGEIAVGERRSSWPRPSKSAVLGLVAAALGYDRYDAPAHGELNDGLHFAVRVDTPFRSRSSGLAMEDGLKPLRDFHTAEFPPQILVKEIDEKQSHSVTRADHLAAIKANKDRRINPVLSERWYWINMAATVALWPTGKVTPPLLAEIAEALREPTFALYLGRKSCPLGRPLFPRIVLAQRFQLAFQHYDTEEAIQVGQVLPERGKPTRDAALTALATAAGTEIWADLNAVPEEERDIRHSRRDAIRDRRSWTFSDREEVCIKTGGGDVPVEG